MRIAIIFLSLILTGCQKADVSKIRTEAKIDNYTGSYVETWHDKENGVRCYIYNGRSISCVKVKP